MNIIGVSGALGHDASCALFVDGRLVGAAEEERFIRDKHAKGKLPYHALRWCLQHACLNAKDIDVVALPYAPIAINNGRSHFAKRYWYAPERAVDALVNGNRRFRRYRDKVLSMLTELGFVVEQLRLVPVEHHLAHASSAYHLSGFKEKTAIIGIDGKGEYATTFFGVGEHGVITKIKEFYDPDSLGGVYGALTQYLGFEMLDGEFKVMGMAPFGDPKRYDLSSLITCNGQSFTVDTSLVNTLGWRRYKQHGKSFYFSKKLVDFLGPRRIGDGIDEPYIHYAASLQALLEKVSLQLIEYYLGDIIRDTGKVCFAGGVALNVKLNQRIMELDGVQQLFVQPAASDSGTAVGAASYAAWQLGKPVLPMEHVYLGPSYSSEQCIAACKEHPARPRWQLVADRAVAGAKILAMGQPLAWFQGRMEFGPRALGNRSILGHPAFPGIADTINSQIKYRERWRPFCPSMLDSVAKDILGTDHPSPYMTFTFPVDKKWQQKIPEVVHEDGTARVQVVTRETNRHYYDLIAQLQQFGGHGCILNTSLNRRGEPMVCSPSDALAMFFGSDLNYLMMEDVLVEKDNST